MFWLLSFCLSKNIYPPKPNCLPRDRAGVCASVCVCMFAYHTRAHTEKALLARAEKNNTADCFPTDKGGLVSRSERGRFTACGFKRLETEAILKGDLTEQAAEMRLVSFNNINPGRATQKPQLEQLNRMQPV